jgi:hypothetical protein
MGPIAESPAACWIHLGLASVALRRRVLDDARLRLCPRQRRGATGRAGRVGAAGGPTRMDTGQTARADEVLAQA